MAAAHRHRFRGPTPHHALVAISLLVVSGCGASTGEAASHSTSGADPTAPADLVEAGAITAADLSHEGPLSEWERSETDPAPVVDPDLPDTDLVHCADLSITEPSLTAGLVDSALSPTFGAATDSITTINVSARGAVYVYSDTAAAETAFSRIGVDTFDSCIAPSIDPEADEGPQIQLRETDDAAQSRRFSAAMDDYVYFGGNDNAHRFEAHVLRVDRVVTVVQFVFGGQYFDDVEEDLEAVQRGTIRSLVGRLEAATS